MYDCSLEWKTRAQITRGAVLVNLLGGSDTCCYFGFDGSTIIPEGRNSYDLQISVMRWRNGGEMLRQESSGFSQMDLYWIRNYKKCQVRSYGEEDVLLLLIQPILLLLLLLLLAISAAQMYDAPGINHNQFVMRSITNNKAKWQPMMDNKYEGDKSYFEKEMT